MEILTLDAAGTGTLKKSTRKIGVTVTGMATNNITACSAKMTASLDDRRGGKRDLINNVPLWQLAVISQKNEGAYTITGESDDTFTAKFWIELAPEFALSISEKEEVEIRLSQVPGGQSINMVQLDGDLKGTNYYVVNTHSVSQNESNSDWDISQYIGLCLPVAGLERVEITNSIGGVKKYSAAELRFICADANDVECHRYSKTGVYNCINPWNSEAYLLDTQGMVGIEIFTDGDPYQFASVMLQTRL